VDHLGSTRVLWDSAGVKGRYDYMPFGDAIPSDRNKRDSVSCAAGVTACYAGSGSLTMRFTGKERDAETSNSAMGDGLDYFGARYFSAAQGRFTSPDKPFADQHPEDPQSWNLYSYVTNNPLRFIDRNGLAKIEVRYNKIGPGYTHSYVVVTDRNGAQTYFRGGPTAGGTSSPGLSLPSYSGGSSSQSSRSGSSDSSGSSSSNSSNSSSPGSGPGGPGANTGPFGAIVAEHGAYTPDSIDYSTHPAASKTVLSNDEPASGYINQLGQYENAVNQSGIPYNPLSTNSNAYAAGAVQSLGLTPPTNHPLAPGSGTNLPVTPPPQPPPPPPAPSCSVPGTGGACRN
jgi:RHS repeat-associated protein